VYAFVSKQSYETRPQTVKVVFSTSTLCHLLLFCTTRLKLDCATVRVGGRVRRSLNVTPAAGEGGEGVATLQ
jgi:hypothetical protein